jgi:outer membrane protein assembly factor BamB
MTKTMMRRRTALSGLTLAFLTACAAKKTPIIGTQIPVVSMDTGMDVAPDAPAVTLPPAAPLADWPQSLANTAHAPGNIAAPLNFKPLWNANAGAPGGYRTMLRASPLIANGQAFAMDSDAAVRAYALNDGHELWHTGTKPKHTSIYNMGGGIAYDSGTIYASTGYGEVLALDANSGKILWRQPLLLPARSAPMVAGALVAVIIYNDVLMTFDAATGTPGWRFSGNAGQPSSAAVGVTGAPAYSDGIIVAGFSTGMLAGIDAKSGTPLWEQSLAAGYGQASALDFSDIVAPPVIANGVVYAVNLGDTFMAVDLHSGVKVWTHSASGINAPAAAGGFLFLLDGQQMLYAVHADDGLVSWSLQMPAFKKPKNKGGPILWSGPVLLDGQLVLTNDQGHVALVDAVAGKIVQTAKLGGPADMPPIAAAGTLLQLTRNAKLTAYG